MPFKVVQTIANGELLIIICPENWESGGKLFWPSMVQGEKPIAKIMNCVVKRVHLTLEQAQAAVEAKSDIPEMEEEESTSRKIRKRKKETNKITPAPFSSLNNFVELCLTREKHTSYSLKKESTSMNNLEEQILVKEKQTSVGLIENDPLEDEQQMFTDNENDEMDNDSVISNNNYHGNENTTINSLSDKIDKLFTAVGVVQENQKTTQETVDRILGIISSKDLKLDELIKGTQSDMSTDYGMAPIDCKSSFTEFEDKLKDPAELKKNKKKFVMICGSGKGKGLRNCYALVDAMFTRRFLTECSWSGGSRNERSKICFKSYERVLNFFYSVIRESDPTFTIMECKGFFQNILKCSTRRNAAKGLRTSAPRNRRKKRNPAATTKINIDDQASTSVVDEDSISTFV